MLGSQHLNEIFEFSETIQGAVEDSPILCSLLEKRAGTRWLR